MTAWARLIPLEAPIDITGDEARRRALEILDKAKYFELPSWLSDLLSTVSNLLGRIVQAVLTRPLVSGSGLNWPLLVVVLLVVGLGVFIVWRVGLPRRATRAAAQAAVEADTTVDPQEYRSLAQRAADAGDFTTAIRERFRSITRLLEDVTVLEPRPARTAFEVARLAGALLPDVATQLTSAAQLFGEVSYSGRAGRSGEYAAIVAWERDITVAAQHRDLTSATSTTVERPPW